MAFDPLAAGRQRLEAQQRQMMENTNNQRAYLQYKKSVEAAAIKAAAEEVAAQENQRLYEIEVKRLQAIEDARWAEAYNAA